MQLLLGNSNLALILFKFAVFASDSSLVCKCKSRNCLRFKIARDPSLWPMITVDESLVIAKALVKIGSFEFVLSLSELCFDNDSDVDDELPNKSGNIICFLIMQKKIHLIDGPSSDEFLEDRGANTRDSSLMAYA